MNCPIVHWCFSLLFIGVFFAPYAHADITDIYRIYHQPPQRHQFSICQGGGCAILKTSEISEDEWKQVEALFAPMPETETQERQLIAQAIGLIEGLVGEKIGTTLDKAGTFNNADYPGQQDCNDESINTTTYLRLLKQGGLMRMHEVEDMRTRHFFFSGWPHTTAVIHALSDQHRFAVDSWFYDNGEPATIVPFEQWKAGYVPEDSPIKHR